MYDTKKAQQIRDCVCAQIFDDDRAPNGTTATLCKRVHDVSVYGVRGALIISDLFSFTKSILNL